MIDLQRVERGSLLQVIEGISVPFGRVEAQEDGHYLAINDDSAEEELLPPGSPIVLMGEAIDNPDAIVVLADGRLGWVFRDEVAHVMCDV